MATAMAIPEFPVSLTVAMIFLGTFPLYSHAIARRRPFHDRSPVTRATHTALSAPVIGAGTG